MCQYTIFFHINIPLLKNSSGKCSEKFIICKKYSKEQFLLVTSKSKMCMQLKATDPAFHGGPASGVPPLHRQHNSHSKLHVQPLLATRAAQFCLPQLHAEHGQHRPLPGPFTPPVLSCPLERDRMQNPEKKGGEGAQSP